LRCEFQRAEQRGCASLPLPNPNETVAGGRRPETHLSHLPSPLLITISRGGGSRRVAAFTHSVSFAAAYTPAEIAPERRRLLLLRVPSPAAHGIHLTDRPTHTHREPAMGQNHSAQDGSGHGRRSFQQQPSAQWGAGGGGYYAQDPNAGYCGAPVPQQGGGYAAPYLPPSYQYQPTAAAPAPQVAKPRQLDRRYSRIADDYHSVDQVRVRWLCRWVNRSEILGLTYSGSSESVRFEEVTVRLLAPCMDL
jgi:hypothetical protein